MKQLYTSLLTGAALLVAGAVSAQSTGHGKVQGNGALSHQAVSAVFAGHSAHAGDARGTAPANDACSSVTPQTLASGGTLTFTGNNTGATIDGDYEVGSALEGTGFPSVWHAFTTTAACSNVRMAYCGSSDAFATNFWVVISSACPAGDATMIFNSFRNTVECANGTAVLYFDDLPAGTYYVPVLTDEAGGVAGAYSIEVTASACSAPPANDECAGAISVTPGSWCSPAYYSTEGATESLPGLLCNGATGSADDDVWFSFVATSADMSIGAIGTGDADTGFDGVVEYFSGTCGSLTSLGCADAGLSGSSEPEEIQATGLTVGNTYYVRVYDWYGGTLSDSFGFCVVNGGSINIGIEENATAGDWSIYPNPGTGVFNIQYNGANTATSIDVIDITGRVVYTERMSMAAGTNHAIDLSGMAAGNYNVRLTANGVRTEQRLAVK